jgi:tetratricopeptide (TPR) repeat protein
MSQPTSKRLAFLQKLTSEGSTDPMAFYGLAMEYRSLGLYDEALATFTSLRESNPVYVAMYLMCGQMLEQMSRSADARSWYESGIVRAREARNAHAASELEAALAALG